MLFEVFIELLTNTIKGVGTAAYLVQKQVLQEKLSRHVE